MNPATQPTPAAPVTMHELEGDIIGRLVTWQNLAQLIHESCRVQCTFGIRRDGEWSAGALEIPKELALARVADGIKWSAEQDQEQLVRVSACAGTLWFGASS